MNGNCIDTNIIIKHMRGDMLIVEQMEKRSDIRIPVIVIGELHYGAQKASRRDENLRHFNNFISEYPVAEVNAHIATVYGKLKHALVQQGKNIPENDIWIAAIAMGNNFRLVTCDRHFVGIPGLECLLL